VVLTRNTIRWVLKPLVFLASLGPVVYLAWGAFTGNLGANPISEITFGTGDWTLRFLAISLAVTPLRKLSGWNDLIRFRRMLGLFAFFYGTLHFVTYLSLDRFLDVIAVRQPDQGSLIGAFLRSIVQDVWMRPFITVGFAAFLAMLPLALTSTAGWIRRLGGRNWQRLHRLVYVAAVCGVVHFWWLVKADVREPLIYAVIFGVLLTFRIAVAFSRRPARRAPSSAAGTDLAQRPS
jgi:sulfoxide reductase heme-binding subunit YedZ